MSYEAAKATAGQHLTDRASPDDLKEAAADLRSLSPDSALADLVEAKIRWLLAEGDEHPPEDLAQASDRVRGPPARRRRGPSSSRWSLWSRGDNEPKRTQAMLASTLSDHWRGLTRPRHNTLTASAGRD